MAKPTVKKDGKPVPIGTAAAFDQLAEAFKDATGAGLGVTSGLRTRAEQEALFFGRYRLQPHGTGPFGDVRIYEAKRYVRHSRLGTAAVPGTSRHEKGNALDVHDGGRFPGVTRADNKRSNWLKANAHKFGFDPAGYGFSEPWHVEFEGDPWGGAADGPEPAVVGKTTPHDAVADGLVFFGRVEDAFAGRETNPIDDVRRLQVRLNDAIKAGLAVTGLADPPTRAAYHEYERRLVKKGFLPVANEAPTRIAVERLCEPAFHVK